MSRELEVSELNLNEWELLTFLTVGPHQLGLRVRQSD